SRRRHTRSLRDWSSDVCSSDRSEEHTSELQSSRRRHTRSLRDWSSDVCSSDRSEEHTSELQSRRDLVCRLLLDWSSDVCSSDHSQAVRSLSLASPVVAVCGCLIPFPDFAVCTLLPS